MKVVAAIERFGGKFGHPLPVEISNKETTIVFTCCVAGVSPLVAMVL